MGKGMLERLCDPAEWESLYAHRASGGHKGKGELLALRRFIDNEEYLPVAREMAEGRFSALPTVKELNKKFTEKKRTVFTFPEAYNNCLKLLAHMLNEYDGLFSPCLFSFRRGTGVKTAMHRLTATPGLSDMYSYKVDIHDYFNSVDTDRMLRILRKSIPDVALCDLIEVILREPYSLEGGERVEKKKGIMAGVPISGFLADLYLAELDGWMTEQGVLYARYSDDIIAFADSEERVRYLEDRIKGYLAECGLTVNSRKEFRTRPGEEWEFLGFSYHGGTVDVSRAAVDKLKAKLRRKARTLLRWRRRNSAAPESAIKAYLKHFNRKFYDNPIHNEVTWALWYFPVITSSQRLREIDEYMQQCIRFLYTGKYTKANYNLRYGRMRELGYRSLVAAYYRDREERLAIPRHNDNRKSKFENFDCKSLIC